MPIDKWVVLIAAIGAILWLNWHFFAALRRNKPVGPAVMQEVVVTIKDGFHPKAVRVAAGRPLRLIFDRQETSNCSDEVVISDLDVRARLPAHRRTALIVPAVAAGSYAIGCGMDVVHATLIAE